MRKKKESETAIRKCNGNDESRCVRKISGKSITNDGEDLDQIKYNGFNGAARREEGRIEI